MIRVEVVKKADSGPLKTAISSGGAGGWAAVEPFGPPARPCAGTGPRFRADAGSDAGLRASSNDASAASAAAGPAPDDGSGPAPDDGSGSGSADGCGAEAGPDDGPDDGSDDGSDDGVGGTGAP
ncbi:hypothetical protein [Kitasatospora sp. GP30]|uniref:hypothetical protein n=1 Tax=Kitasatospora sp. GP30 TaxID=3035084 RepID=UPI000C71123A|nr:hypothetical protein [Kitasatospora sp. GP30]